MSAITNVDELLAAARRHGLELQADGAQLDTMGLDFIVAHASDANGTRWIVRSPRRPDVVESARREAAVLARVKGAIGVEVPDWRIHTDELIAYPRLDGIPAVTLDTGAPVWNRIDPAAPHAEYVDSMARVYTRMQQIDGTGLRTRTADESRAKIRAAIETSREALQPSQALQDRWQRWLDGSTWPTHVSLVHGDLHPGHMLLDEQGRLRGILDWTEAEMTDPSVDLAMFGGCYGRTVLGDLIAKMEALGARTWPGMLDHAMERWAVGPAMGAAWGIEHDNPSIVEFSKGMLAAL